MTSRFLRGALAAAAALLLAACASVAPTEPRTATIQRTANGVAHISAPDFETLAYGVAYAHAQDNVCQTAQQLVTVRGERSRWFGGTRHRAARPARAAQRADRLLHRRPHGRRRARQALGRLRAPTRRRMVRGYVAGYNRYLADHAGKLPAACNDQPWVQPMTHRPTTRA